MDDVAVTPSLRENLRGLPPAAWVLFAGTFVNRLGTFVMPFFTLYLTDRGYTAAQAGLAIGAYGLGGLVAQTVGGLLADRIGRRNTIALSMFGAGAVTLLLWKAESLAVIYPLIFLLASVGEVHRPAASALIADLVPSERRMAAFTVFRLAINVGWAAGLALGGLLAQRNFDLLFIGDAVTSISFAVISLIALPHGTRTSRREEAKLPSARSAILADRGFLLFLAAALLSGSVYAQNVSSLPLHVRDAGYGAAAYGFLQSLNGVIVIVLELPVIAWAQHRERLLLVGASCLLIGFAFSALLFADTLPLMVGMVLVWTLGEILGSSAATSIAADRAPEYARGRYQSAIGGAWSLAFMLGPVVGTLVYSSSPEALWLGCGAAGLIAFGLCLAARRHPVPAPPGLEVVDAPQHSG
jgi:MFS family permease